MTSLKPIGHLSKRDIINLLVSICLIILHSRVAMSTNYKTHSLKQTSTMDCGNESPKAEERKTVQTVKMIQGAVDIQSPSTSKGVKRGRGKATPSRAKVASSTHGWSISSSDEAEQSEKEHSLKKGTKRKRSNDDDQSPSTSKGVKRSKGKATPSRAKVASSTHGWSISSSEELEQSETERSLGKGTKRKRTNEEDDEEREVSALSAKKAKGTTAKAPLKAKYLQRVPCPYGKHCYRKNPVHFKEYSHPGNSDYEEGADEVDYRAKGRLMCPYGTSCYRKNLVHFKEYSHPGDSDYEEDTNDEMDDSDRPECPYGTSCYRKNRLHKKQFKHTKDPAEANVNLDDDSFTEDESESVDDSDSEFVPSESDESETTKKEKKALLRNWPNLD